LTKNAPDYLTPAAQNNNILSVYIDIVMTDTIVKLFFHTLKHVEIMHTNFLMLATTNWKLPSKCTRKKFLWI